LLEFDPILLTGVEEIDDQHRALFDRVRALLTASRERRSGEEVLRLFEFLDRYVVEHFATEERVMIESEYPHVEGHRQEHQQLVKELAALAQELRAEGPGALFAIRFGTRVTEWLREHIYRTDRQLGLWIRGRAR
jgi:hemerythrin-like metal-binding protein